jgi:hypothetical protein
MAAATTAGIAQSHEQAQGMRGALILAQAADPDDDGEEVPPRRRGTGEDAEPEDSPIQPLTGAGASGGIDIIDAIEARPPPRVASSAPDTVVCLAGCDGPRGAVVYRKPQP